MPLGMVEVIQRATERATAPQRQRSTQTRAQAGAEGTSRGPEGKNSNKRMKMLAPCLAVSRPGRGAAVASGSALPFWG